MRYLTAEMYMGGFVIMLFNMNITLIGMAQGGENCGWESVVERQDTTS